MQQIKWQRIRTAFIFLFIDLIHCLGPLGGGGLFAKVSFLFKSKTNREKDDIKIEAKRERGEEEELYSKIEELGRKRNKREDKSYNVWKRISESKLSIGLSI